MRTASLCILFLIALIGCTNPPLSTVQQMVEAQAKLLIDSGYIENKYVVLYELTLNDSNHIYQIADSEFPVDGSLELPSKIVGYKDKFLCFVELDEPEMPMAEMEKITHYSGNPIFEESSHTYIYKWLLAVSTSGQKKTLADILPGDVRSFFDMTELWPHFPGYVKDCPVQMGIISHDVKIAHTSNDFLNADSVRQDLFRRIETSYGEVYLRNNTDSFVCLTSDTNNHYAIVNNRDSLYLSLCDLLPITLGPHESREIEYESIPNEHFFNNLVSEGHSWEYFNHLFCESTYCLMKLNGEDYKTRVMFFGSLRTSMYGFKVTNESGENLFKILNHGIYDKEERRERNTRFWLGS